MRGRCPCGSVTHALGGNPAAAVCRCTGEQKQTGTSFALQMAVPSGAIEVRGDLRSCRNRGGSGLRVDRFFCPYCGSPIYAHAQLKPDLFFIVIGTPSVPSTVTPAIQIHCDRAQPWLHLNGSQSFPKTA